VADASGGRFAELTTALRNHPRVIVRGLVAFDDLIAAYRGASVALDLMARNPERELAFTTRTMIYLYCGLPVIHNNYSEVGRLVRERGCGWALDPDDEIGFRRAVRSVLDASAPLESLRRAALATASDYSWDKTIGPLADFCANPRQREGRLAIALAAEARRREAEALREERDALRSELLAIKGRLAYRLLQRLPALGALMAPFAYLAGWILAAAVYLRLRRTNR
jgi:glycosyltransferase involved in cell wall biosynthesis